MAIANVSHTKITSFSSQQAWRYCSQIEDKASSFGINVLDVTSDCTRNELIGFSETQIFKNVVVAYASRYCPTTLKISCHLNLLDAIFFSVINEDEFVFISRTRSEIDCTGFNPTNIWAWSGIRLIASILWLLFWTMPVMYLCSSSLCCLGIKFCLPWTANTIWIYSCVYVLGIYVDLCLENNKAYLCCKEAAPMVREGLNSIFYKQAAPNGAFRADYQ